MAIGRTRLKLAEMLRAKGFDVQAEDLWTQRGGYRHRHWDLARWGHTRSGIASWDKMTDCVRYGIMLGDDNEIHACGQAGDKAKARKAAKLAEAVARERKRREARRERFKIYRCSCGLQFPFDGGELACWHCGCVETLTDVTRDIL